VPLIHEMNPSMFSESILWIVWVAHCDFGGLQLMYMLVKLHSHIGEQWPSHPCSRHGFIYNGEGIWMSSHLEKKKKKMPQTNINKKRKKKI